MKCKICNTEKEVQFYEICNKIDDKVLVSGDFCPECIVLLATKAKSATFEFEDEDVTL